MVCGSSQRGDGDAFKFQWVATTDQLSTNATERLKVEQRDFGALDKVSGLSLLCFFRFASPPFSTKVLSLTIVSPIQSERLHGLTWCWLQRTTATTTRMIVSKQSSLIRRKFCCRGSPFSSGHYCPIKRWIIQTTLYAGGLFQNSILSSIHILKYYLRSFKKVQWRRK